MNKLIISSLIMLNLLACNNKVDTQVPSKIDVDVKDSVQTVNVIHTIGLSIQMEAYFRTACINQVDTITPGLPEPQRTQAIDACVVASSQKFIDDFMALINKNVGT